jgi:hypothetical protein
MDKKIRPDISNALIHLTGDRTCSGRLSAEQALHSILREGIIHGSGNDGFIKGTQHAVCFTEMPLGSIKYYINDNHGSKHKYDYFGIALPKTAAWEAGARPVIYLPDNEAHWIPNKEKWRHVQFKLRDIDFTHEREWRLMGDLDLSKFNFYVIVPNKEHENKILEIDSPVAKKIIGFLHMHYLNDLL